MTQVEQIGKLKTLGSHSDTDQGRGSVKTPQSVEGDDQRVFMQRHGKPFPASPLILFARFDAQLSTDSQRKIKSIAESLSGKPNKIEIRGHTSSRPLPERSQLRDHFALAYRRSRNAFDLLAASDVEKDRMRIVSVGDNRPPELAADALSIQADRVEIVVLDTFANEYIGPKDEAK